MLTVLDAAGLARQLRVDAFVNKPFDAEALMAEVERLSPVPLGRE